MEVVGKIKVIGAQQQVSATFVKRELVVTTNEQYPQHIMIEFAQDKVDLIDPYQVGQEVKVHINLRGRLWTSPQGEDKYFNSIHGWRIEKVGEAPVQAQQAPAPIQEHPENDLPF